MVAILRSGGNANADEPPRRQDAEEENTLRRNLDFNSERARFGCSSKLKMNSSRIFPPWRLGG
jgi:hypothetical protein